MALVPELDEASIDLAAVEVRPYRASGPGGQHRNKRWTAVRITHLPSGTVVVCADERSYEANRRRALATLEERLSADAAIAEQGRVNAIRNAQVTTDRSAKSFTHNHQRGEVISHDSGHRWRLRDWQRGRM